MTTIGLNIKDAWYEDKGKPVLQGVNLIIPGGQGIGLHDPSGLSSADLLKICATLLEPTRGEFYLEERPVPFGRELDLLPLRRRIAYITLDTALISNLTLSQNVCLGWAYHENKSLYDIWEEGRKLLTYFQINDYKNMRPAEVTAEIFKRTVCARELAKKPILILLDKTIEALSTEGQALLIAYIEKCMQEIGSSLLVASTNTVSLSPFAAIISRLYTLADGKIME